MEDYSKQDFLNKIKWLENELWWSKDENFQIRNKINKLEDELKESKRLNTQNRNKINRLEADLASVEDFSDKQADVIRYYLNEIKQLRANKQNNNQIKGLVNGQR
jgi:septal ring factor EnvC (AmiA/AmiB activator)